MNIVIYLLLAFYAVSILGAVYEFFRAGRETRPRTVGCGTPARPGQLVFLLVTSKQLSAPDASLRTLSVGGTCY